MKLVVTDETLNKWAEEFINEYTKSGIPLYMVYSFEEFVEKKKTAIEEAA